jgi:transcriptional regulator
MCFGMRYHARPMTSLYLPKQFQRTELELALTLMREHPLAQLISLDDDGQPFVTPLPLHAVADGARLSLLGHCAKPNPHWRYLQTRAQSLVTFMGPQAYMSPSVYPDLVRVPTWSYVYIHCTVSARLIEDEAGKDRLLKTLIADHEPAYAAQWRALGEGYQHKMLSGIVGFELSVLSLDAKYKLNQHRPEAHAAMHQTYAQGSAQEQALALWMERLGMVEKVPVGHERSAH